MKRKVSNCKWLGISDLNLLFTQAREHIFFEPLRQILVDEEDLILKKIEPYMVMMLNHLRHDLNPIRMMME